MFTSAIGGRSMCIDALHGREKNFEVGDVVIEIVSKFSDGEIFKA
jgi:hypothetical protein